MSGLFGITTPATPAGVYVPVAGSYAASGTDVVTARVAGDTHDRLVIDADGSIRWGSGAGASDASIRRDGVGIVGIVAETRADGRVWAMYGAATQVGIGNIGPASEAAVFIGDATNVLYKTAASSLRTNAALTVDGALSTADNLAITTAGKGVRIEEGANARMGVATLVAGTVTVPNTSVTASSRAFLSVQTAGGTVGAIALANVVAGTSFDIVSTSALDTSTVAWVLIEGT